MPTLIFTNINQYLTTHEAFRLQRLIEWAELFDCYFFVRRCDSSNVIPHPKLFYSSIFPDHTLLKHEIDMVLKYIKPNKVINLLEKFFPWDLVQTDAEKIYFVRSCAKKLFKILIEYGADRSTLEIYKELSEREELFINISDRLITDSPNSQNAVMEMYKKKTPICLQFINPTKYNSLPLPTNKKLVYNIGRRDYQKGLHFIKSPKKYNVISIGKFEVSEKEYISTNIERIKCSNFENYINIIKTAYFGIFPSIWESNGYAVQECLAMGKIPIVQKNSGGNEYLCNKDNSIIIDFKKGNAEWEQIIESVDLLENMAECARLSVTYKMYKDSLDLFGEQIC